VAGLFPLFTDAHVQQRLVRGLRQRGWDVVRAIDVFPEKTPDDVLFEYAAKEGRVFVTNDEPIHKLAMRWLSEGRPFPGLVFWRQERYQEMTTGDFLKAFDALAAQEEPFAYPIYYPKLPEKPERPAKRSKRKRRKR